MNKHTRTEKKKKRNGKNMHAYGGGGENCREGLTVSTRG